MRHFFVEFGLRLGFSLGLRLEPYYLVITRTPPTKNMTLPVHFTIKMAKLTIDCYTGAPVATRRISNHYNSDDSATKETPQTRYQENYITTSARE